MSEIVDLKILNRRLQKYFNAYGSIPERRLESAQRTQTRFMEELDRILGDQTPTRPSLSRESVSNWSVKFRTLKDGFFSWIGRRAITYVLFALIVFGIFLSGGVSATAYAASSALPGDSLYPLKTTTEHVRARWTPDASAQVQLYLHFAGQRLGEMQALIREGRLVDVGIAANEFDRDVEEALRAIEYISQHQPAKALELKLQAHSILQVYTRTLIAMLAGVPGEAQAEIQRAIHTSESAAVTLQATAGEVDDDDVEGRVGGRDGANDCRAQMRGDDDECDTSGEHVVETPTPTLQPTIAPSRNETNNNSNNNNENNSGGGIGGDDDGEDDDDSSEEDD